jgi:hypothetical protein
MAKNVSMQKRTKTPPAEPEPQGPPAFPGELLAEARAVISRRDKLIETEQRLLADLEQQVSVIAAARTALGDAQLDEVMAGSPPNGASGEALQRLAEAEAHREKLRALLASARARLDNQRDDVAYVLERLVPAQREWAAQTWTEFASRRLIPAAEQYRAVVAEAIALSAALGMRFDTGVCAVDPGPQPATPDYAEPHQLVQRLQAFERRAADEARLLAKYRDYDVRYNGVAIPDGAVFRFRHEQAVSGRVYRRGESISADTCHPGLLRRLIASHIVIPVSWSPGEREARREG